MPQALSCHHTLYLQRVYGVRFIRVKRKAAVHLGVAAKDAGFEVLGGESLRIKLHHATSFAKNWHTWHKLHIVVLQSQTAMHRCFLQSADRHIEIHLEFGHARGLAFFKRTVQKFVEGRPRNKGLHICQGASRLGFDGDVERLHVRQTRVNLVPHKLWRAC